MKKLNVILILLCVFFMACTKKEYPESIRENEPVFYMKATINSVDYEFNAGVNDYRMYSSYTQDSNGVYNLIADMKQANCNGSCVNSLKIQINDAKTLPANAAVDISNALSPRNYDYFMPAQEIQFKSGFNKTAKSYLWDFGDGTKSTLPNPSHVYLKKGYYKVSLTITDANNCSSSVSTIQKTGFANKTCIASIGLTAQNINTLSFTAFTAGKVPLNYLWDFGDGSSSTLAAPVHFYKYAGSYPVSLRVIDTDKDTAFAAYNAVTQQDNSSCAANYTVVSVSDQLAAANKALSEVMVTWTDASGTVFKSSQTSQPTGSAFKIVSVEDFDDNENGQRTKKIKVKFNCDVYNGPRVVNITNAEAVLCVAYK